MNPPRAGSIPVVRPSINRPFLTETQDKPRKHFFCKSSRGFQRFLFCLSPHFSLQANQSEYFHSVFLFLLNLCTDPSSLKFVFNATPSEDYFDYIIVGALVAYWLQHCHNLRKFYCLNVVVFLMENRIF